MQITGFDFIVYDSHVREVLHKLLCPGPYANLVMSLCMLEVDCQTKPHL